MPKVIRMRDKHVVMLPRTVQLPEPLWEALDLIVSSSISRITLDQVMEDAVTRHVSSMATLFMEGGREDLAGKLMHLNLPFQTKLIKQTKRVEALIKEYERDGD